MPVQQPKGMPAYQADILTALANTGIRQLAPGAKARAFADAVADKIGEIEAVAFSNLTETLIPFATGSSLDLIGELYGVPRIQAQTASCQAADRNFRFHVRSGTFGAINRGQDIAIPSGVRISTADSNGPVFLAQSVLLPAASSSQYFSAAALASGSQSNVAAGIFSRHNYTAYSEAQFGSLMVTNDYGVVGGRDQEDDDSYRYRINLFLRSRASANEAALRFAILRIPGIQDVVFDPKAGTFLVYVYAITPVASSSLIQSVQDQINQIVAYPITGLVLSPDLVGISLATVLSVSSSLTDVDKQNVVSAAGLAAQSYINNLPVGVPVVINTLADTISSADSRITDIGDPNHPIQEIYLWRSRSDGSRYSRTLVQNYTPALGERLVVEPSITNPVSLFIP